MAKDSGKTLTFIIITFFICWLLIGVFYAFGGEWGSGKSTGIVLIYMWIPGIVAIYIQKYMYRENLKPTLAVYFKPNRWFFAAWLLPAVIALVANEVGLELPWHEYSPDMEGFIEKLSERLSPEQIEQMKTGINALPVPFFWVIFFQGLIGGITISAVFAMGEELGWRGFLVRQFLHIGFWKSSALIGFIWGIWHAPIILMGHNYPEHPVAGVGMMVVFCLLISPILSYVRLKAKSVVAAAIFHGTINSMAAVPILMIKGGNDLTEGLTGLAGFIVLLMVNIALFVYERFLADEPLTVNIIQD